MIRCVFDYRHYIYINGNDFYSSQSVLEFRISGIIILKGKARKSCSDSHRSVNLSLFTLCIGLQSSGLSSFDVMYSMI